MAPKQRYLTKTQAADYLGLTVKALERKVEKGQLDVIRIDRHLRFDVTDLDLFMRRHRVQAST